MSNKDNVRVRILREWDEPKPQPPSSNDRDAIFVGFVVVMVLALFIMALA